MYTIDAVILRVDLSRHSNRWPVLFGLRAVRLVVSMQPEDGCNNEEGRMRRKAHLFRNPNRGGRKAVFAQTCAQHIRRRVRKQKRSPDKTRTTDRGGLLLLICPDEGGRLWQRALGRSEDIKFQALYAIVLSPVSGVSVFTLFVVVVYGDKWSSLPDRTLIAVSCSRLYRSRRP